MLETSPNPSKATDRKNILKWLLRAGARGRRHTSSGNGKMDREHKQRHRKHDRAEQHNLIELVEMRTTDRRSERAAGTETTKHPWHVLPDK